MHYIQAVTGCSRTGDNPSNIAVKMSQAIGIEIMIFSEVIEKV